MGRIVLIASALALSACSGILTWATAYSLRSPDGKAEVKVQTLSNFSDSEVRVAVSKRWSTETIGYRSDCGLMFAHAAWRKGVVAVFVDGLWCGQIRVAYDTTAGRVLDFKTVEPWLGEDIVNSYGVSADELAANGGDVLKWATYPGDGRFRRSMNEFRRRTAR